MVLDTDSLDSERRSECQNRYQKGRQDECLKRYAIECQNRRRIECKNECRIICLCQNRCQIELSDRLSKYMPQKRISDRIECHTKCSYTVRQLYIYNIVIQLYIQNVINMLCIYTFSWYVNHSGGRRVCISVAREIDGAPMQEASS